MSHVHRLAPGSSRRVVQGPATGSRRWRHAAIVVASLVAVVVGADPAAADPPGPTNYESTVTGVEPGVEGLEVAVLGGDSFLQVRNDGHEVLVPGYDGREQYLRFDPDGTVSVNVRSATHAQNDARYGVAGDDVPDDVGPDQPPRWEPVSTDGTWAWHDHRIHWMSPTTLPGDVDPDRAEAQEAFAWQVPMEVDGTVVAVTGTLVWEPDVPPWAALAGLLVGLAAGVLLVLRRAGPGAIAAVVGLGVVATGVVGLAATAGLPPGVQPEPLPLVLPGIAAVVAGAAWLVRHRTAAAGALAGAAGVPLVVWAVSRVATVTAPIVPPAVLPSALVRSVVGLAAGIGLGALVAGLRDLFTRPLGPPAATPDVPSPDHAATDA